MKNICNILLLLLISTGLWAQSFNIQEITPGYIGGNTPSTYISSCHIPTERIFRLRVFVNSADDKVILTNVYFTNSCATGSTVTLSSSVNGTYNAGTSQIGKHIEFTIKTKDTYIPYFSCELRADWTFQDFITTVDDEGVSTTRKETKKRKNVNLKDYWYIGIIKDYKVKDFSATKQCGIKERIRVHITYENDIDTYSVTATNATIVPNTLVKSNSQCTPVISFDLDTERCGDVTFEVTRTNAIGTKSEPFIITNEFTEVGHNAIESFSNGQTDFCVANGSVNVVLKGAFNEHFFGTDRPNTAQLFELANACSPIEAAWTVSSSTTPGGISFYSINPATDFAYGSFYLHAAGEYIIDYTLVACGKTTIKRIKLTACEEAPVLISTPPIDLQHICSLGEPICAPIANNGCFNKITATSSDNKLLVTSYDETLCLGSAFLRKRTSPLNVTLSNACGSASTIWDIYIDDPAFCENMHEKLNLKVEQGSQTITIRLEPSSSAKSRINTTKKELLKGQDESIQKVIVYDMNGHLISTHNRVNANNTLVLPSHSLQAGTYVIQVITNQQTYSKPFIKA
ncbi:MAG: T9SS type A sorting domain-containing protein [Aureispira sp.]